MLTMVKLLLGAEGSGNDELLSFLIESTTQKVLNYCNRPDLPKELELIIVEIVVEQFRNQNGEQRITSVKRGDTQISYQQSNIGADFIKNYKAQLNKFRRVGTL